MNLTGNTILITGGGSGIGRALAQRFCALGNKVVIAGRNENALADVRSAYPDIAAMTLDLSDADSVRAFAGDIIESHPSLNVVISNAGIAQIEDLQRCPEDLDTPERAVEINLLGPIRLTSALLPHFLAKRGSTIMTVSSGLAFVPYAAMPTYCATKAAIHVYTMALREQLRGAGIDVIEIVPPYVQTQLTGAHQACDPRAMSLDVFADEVLEILGGDPVSGEVVVERARPERFAEKNKDIERLFAELNQRF